ncbi:MAG: DUF473 domain-containing protein [Thermococci archaeon]|nr:DUF473 domain-containing protein [Thermococci archaeon]
MEAIMLSGIARRVLDELLHNPYRTIEVRSARNVEALERAEAGGKLFLTYDSAEDIHVGTEGLVVELLRVEEMETRIPWEESDEREVTVCRAQVRLVGLGRIMEIRREGNVTKVRIRELMPHEMSMG